MLVDWDVVDGTKVKRSRRMLEIRRMVVVSQIPLDCTFLGGTTDPSVLLKVQTVLPAIGTVYSDPAWPAYLEDIEIDSVRSVDTVVVALIYKLDLTLGDPAAPATWIKTTDTLSFTEETQSTANGIANLLIYYRSGLAPPGNNTIPVTAYQRCGKARKMRGYKVMTVTGRMYHNTWLTTVAPLVEPAEFCINSDGWGPATRGQWLYLGAKVEVPLLATTSSAILVATITLRFIKEKLGHFPLLVYLNERHEHPGDTILEGALRALGLPALGGITRRNGKGLASIYDEITYADKFAFTPDS